MVLWGGISQDYVIPDSSDVDFEDAVERAAKVASEDPRCIVGVADHVPNGAPVDRLRAAVKRLM